MTDIADVARRVARREHWPSSPERLRGRIKAIMRSRSSRWIAVRKLPTVSYFVQHARFVWKPEAGPVEGRQRSLPGASSSRAPGGSPVDGARVGAGVDDRKRRDRT